jgi:predicted nucleic acid-binding protein
VLLLDTTVLVYAKGADHPLREPCRRLIDAIDRGAVRATTTAEVIQEFVHVRARRRDRHEAADLGRAYVDLLSPLLPVSDAVVREALRLFERHRELGTFDALLGAAAIEASAELVSADAAFAAVAGLRHIDPASRDMNRVLEA